MAACSADSEVLCVQGLDLRPTTRPCSQQLINHDHGQPAVAPRTTGVTDSLSLIFYAPGVTNPWRLPDYCVEVPVVESAKHVLPACQPHFRITNIVIMQLRCQHRRLLWSIPSSGLSDNIYCRLEHTINSHRASHKQSEYPAYPSPKPPR